MRRFACRQAEGGAVGIAGHELEPALTCETVLGQLVRRTAEPVVPAVQRANDREQQRRAAGPERRVGVGHVLAALRVSERPQLRAKRRRLDGWNGARRAAAARYSELLADVAGVRTPAVRPGNEDVWHLYVIRVDERDRVLAELGAAGIGAGIHYPTPVHLTEAYRSLGYRRGQFPVAEAAADRILSLPMFPHLTEAQQDRVVDCVTGCV